MVHLAWVDRLSHSRDHLWLTDKGLLLVRVAPSVLIQLLGGAHHLCGEYRVAWLGRIGHRSGTMRGVKGAMPCIHVTHLLIVGRLERLMLLLEVGLTLLWEASDVDVLSDLLVHQLRLVEVYSLLVAIVHWTVVA